MLTEYQQKKLLEIAAYIIHVDNAELENYTDYCEENGWNPADINGKDQSGHVYAKALIALGLEYSES